MPPKPVYKPIKIPIDSQSCRWYGVFTMSEPAQTANDDTDHRPDEAAEGPLKPDPTVDPKDYCFEREIVDLMQNEHFVGPLSLRIPKVQDWNCETAYIRVGSDANIRMGYNPEWLRRMPSKHRVGIFIHEFLHVALMHVTERNVEDRRLAKMWNIATDLAINSMIGADRLPEATLLPGRAPKTNDKGLSDLIVSFPLLESADWYMERLMQYAEANAPANGDDYEFEIGPVDDHGGWGDIPEEVRDILKEHVRSMIEQGVKNAHNRASWGCVPAQAQRLIEALLKHELDWKAILKMFVGRTRSMERLSSMKRINKRAPYLMPGPKRSTFANVIWFIDQSGSVGDEDVQRGLAEGFACSKHSKIDVVNFDTEIDMSSFQSVQNGQNFKWERTRCGGTDFNAVANFLNKPENRKKYSAAIIFTDGYAPKMAAVNGTRVLWLITETGTMSAPRPGDLVVQMSKDKTVKRAA